MSGSPKYAEIQMREAEERRLREERRRRAEEERRRREEAERRARLALVQELSGAVNHEAQALRVEVAALRSAVHESGSSWSVLHLEPEIDAAKNVAREPEALAAALGQLRAMAARVSALRTQVSRQAASLASAQDQIRREAAAEAMRLAEASRQQEAERQREAIQASTELRVRLAGFEADDVAMAWSGDVMEETRGRLVELEGSPDPAAIALALHQRLDAALEHAQERQLAEERRAHIVASLQAGLREQGFQVGEPVLVGEGDGEVAFRASRADRRWVEVNVPLEGHVFYDVDGVDRVVEQGGDGLSYTNCDDTEARLEALHSDIEARFGVQTGELLWESKDPNRNQRNANELPSGGPASSRTRR